MTSTGGFYGFSADPSTVAYHPVGNCPPVDVTEGRRLPPSPELLLLGCGDVRSVLYTCHVLHTTCPALPRALHFHLNDIEAGVLARDLLLLRLASSGETTHDFRFLWSVWYECLLRSDHADRLRETLKKLCDDVTGDDDVGKSQQNDVIPSNHDVTPSSHDVTPSSHDVTPSSDVVTPSSHDVTPRRDDVSRCTGGDDVRNVNQGGDGVIKSSDDLKESVQDTDTAAGVTENAGSEGRNVDFRFGNEATREAVKKALEDYGRMSVPTTEVFKGRNGYMGRWGKALDRVGLLTERIASVFQEQQGCMKDPQLRKRCRKEIEGFIRTGMTSVSWSTQNEAELRRDYTGNPTYFRPGNPTWCITEGACVFLSRDLDLSAGGYDGGETTLSSLCFTQMAEHVRSFQALQRQGVRLTFTLWHGEALELSHSGLPAEQRFDVINTSNLVDNVGLLNLLVMYAGRLRPGTGILSVQSFFWHTEDNLEAFLQKFLPVNVFFIQTLLGVKWEGDERRHNCASLRLGTFVGREAFRFFLRSTPEPTEKVKLTGTDALTAALETVFAFCVAPRCPVLGYRPVVSGIRTYLHLIKNLSNRVEGGVETLSNFSYAFVVVRENPVMVASVPSIVALEAVHLGRRFEEDLVEVSIPVQIEGEEELHFCYIVLTPFGGLNEALMGLQMQWLFPGMPLFIIKDFTFDPEQKRVSFYFPEKFWAKVGVGVKACFENCFEGKECLLKTVLNVRSVASVRRLPRVAARAIEGSPAPACSSQRPRGTRRGIASLQLVEHRDSFVVTIASKEDFQLPVFVTRGETSRHVKVSTGSERSDLQWKAILPCEVDADLATADLDIADDDDEEEEDDLDDDDDGDDIRLVLDIPKDEANLAVGLSDWRSLDARRLPSYAFNRHSELTLYLNFWRAFPSEGLHLGIDLWPQELAPHVAVRDLMLETMHAAIHRSTPLVVTVELQDGDLVRHFLLLQLHGFKVIGDSPGLVVTVLWPEEANAMMRARKLRKRTFDREMEEWMRMPRHPIQATPVVQAAVPHLVTRLQALKQQLLQDPQRDEAWIFQSYIKPYHSELNWITCYTGTNAIVGCPGAMANLIRSSAPSRGSGQDYSWCCPRDDFASMCLKCLLASGREFHHLQKNDEGSAKGMLSMGSFITTFTCEEDPNLRVCSYCGSQPERLNECKSCGKARYCCEECLDRDKEHHRESCASPSFSPFSSLATSSGDQAKSQQSDEQAAGGAGAVGAGASKDSSPDPHNLGGARSKVKDDSSVSWWKPGAKVQSSSITGRNPAPIAMSAASKTKDQRSNAKGREPTGKRAPQEDTSLSWWKPGAKIQNSSIQTEKPSAEVKPGESETSKARKNGDKAGKKGQKTISGKSGAAGSSAVSWWTSGAKIQSSSPQGSTKLPGEGRPAETGSREASLEERGIRRCDACGKASGHLKRCTRCKTVSYCSTQCQTLAWKEHRKHCSAI